MADFDPKKWDWWEAALAAVDANNRSLIGSDRLPIYDEPMTGFFRVRTHKGGPFIPVRIWYAADGELKGHKNGVACEAVSISGLWSHCSSHPISHENYTAFLESRKDPATPNGVWFDEIVASVGAKVMSSHVAEAPAEPKADAPAKRGRGRPRKNPADVEPEKPAEEEPADVRTEEQKGAYHSNGEPMWAKDGTLLDEKGNRSIFDDVDAREDEPEVDEWGDPIVRAEPPMRYWMSRTGRPFSLPLQPGGEGWVEITADEYEAEVKKASEVRKAPAQKASEAEADAPMRFFLNTDTGALLKSTKNQPGHFKEVTAERYQAMLYEHEKSADDQPAENDRAKIGDNSGTEFEQLVDEIDEWSRIVAKLREAGPAKTKDDAAKVADAKAKLGDLWKALEAMRKAEKAPHDAAAKAVQEKFVPILKRAEAAGDTTVVLLKPYLDEQNRLERERVAEENRLAREQAAKEREAAEEFGDPAPEVIVREVKAKNVGVGNRRTASVIRRQIAVVTDAKAAMAYFGAQEPLHPDFTDLLRKLGGKVMNGGLKVPGMEMKIEESVR